LKKNKLGCCDGNCSRLINELVLTKISGNIPKLWILHGFYHET
jgi:hypothetical protein